ncbi:MAG: phosphoglycerate kinase [Nanoarchaeota archaeon]
MAQYKTIRDINLKNKRVLIRVDFNVEIKDDIIVDPERIISSFPTINYVLEKGGKPILMSHLGRPIHYEPTMSLMLVGSFLEKRLRRKVLFAPESIGIRAERIVNTMKDGEVVLLENLRFHPEEEQNNPRFVEELEKLCDVYIDDAFGTSHRKHASTYGVPLKCKEQGKEVGIGFLMEKEIEMWKPILEDKHNGILIVGGGKLKEKISAVKELSKSFSKVIIGGVVANVFLSAKEYEIKKSKVSEKNDNTNYIAMAREILRSVINIRFPKKMVIAKLNGDKFTDRKTIALGDALPDDYVIVDCIPNEDDILDITRARCVVWFGPMGIYEKGFLDGTKAIAKAMNENKNGHNIIGGGDLITAVEVKAKISTGGGASITLLRDRTLPALDVLM